MNVEQLYAECLAAGVLGSGFVSLIKPKKMPPGFPRGEFLSDTHRGKVYRYEASKIIAWMNENDLLPKSNTGGQK